jgi:hypothetical protein
MNSVNSSVNSVNSGNNPSTSPIITRHSSITSIPLYSILLEVHSKDGEPFDGALCRDSMKSIWTDHLDRKAEEIRLLESERIRGKYLKINFILREETPILAITKSLETQFELKIGSKIHSFGVRFPQFKEISCELGKLITVTFYKVPIGIYCEDLRLWLNLFGEVKGNFRYSLLALFISGFLVQIFEFRFTDSLSGFLVQYLNLVSVHFNSFQFIHF